MIRRPLVLISASVLLIAGWPAGPRRRGRAGGQRRLRRHHRSLVVDRRMRRWPSTTAGPASTCPAAPPTGGTPSSARTTSTWSRARPTGSPSPPPATPPGHVARAVVGLAVAPVRHLLRSVAGPAGRRRHATRTPSPRRPHRAGPGAFQVGGSADRVALLPGRRLAARRRAARGLRAGHRPAGAGQPGRLPAGRAEERHPGHRGDRRRCRGSCKNAGGDRRRAAARPRRAAWTPASGPERAHRSTSARYRDAGTGYTLVADGETSRPFDIGARRLRAAAADALKFYYTQRSGIAILDDAAPRLRPAGRARRRRAQPGRHATCRASPASATTRWTSRGGWYDAGDHGKYVVNGGISVYQLMSEYERTSSRAPASPARCGDGTLRHPGERQPGARTSSTRPAGSWSSCSRCRCRPASRYAGMAHHKIHDADWTGLPLLPAPRPAAARAAPGRRPPRRSTWPPRRPRRARALRAVRPALRRAARWPRRGPPAPRPRPTRPSTPPGPTASAAAPTTTTTSPTSSTGRRPSCTSPPARRSTGTTSSPRRTTPPTCSRAGGFDWGNTAAARPARPGHGAQPRCPAAARVRPSVVDGADKYLATAERPRRTACPYAPAEQHVRLGLEQPGPQQHGR